MVRPAAFDQLQQAGRPCRIWPGPQKRHDFLLVVRHHQREQVEDHVVELAQQLCEITASGFMMGDQLQFRPERRPTT
jgi:hypothetical protein